MDRPHDEYFLISGTTLALLLEKSDFGGIPEALTAGITRSFSKRKMM
jgi:hypothetical protein